MRGKALQSGALPRKSCERPLPIVRHRLRQPLPHAAGKTARTAA